MSQLATSPLASPVTALAAAGRGARAAVAETGLGSAAAATADASGPDDQQVRAAAAQANQALRRRSSELSFEFNDDVGRVVVKLVDTTTREVIRQIPSEEMLQIARALKQDAQTGALLRADA